MKRYACTVRHTSTGEEETITFEASSKPAAAKKIASTGGIEILSIEEAPIEPADVGAAMQAPDLADAVFRGVYRALWIWTAWMFLIGVVVGVIVLLIVLDP